MQILIRQLPTEPGWSGSILLVLVWSICDKQALVEGIKGCDLCFDSQGYRTNNCLDVSSQQIVYSYLRCLIFFNCITYLHQSIFFFFVSLFKYIYIKYIHFICPKCAVLYSYRIFLYVIASRFTVIWIYCTLLFSSQSQTSNSIFWLSPCIKCTILSINGGQINDI